MERDERIEEELFPFYALDALTNEERAEVERYVAANPPARLRLMELTTAAADLSATAEPIQPSAAVKANLMARVEADAQSAAPGRASTRRDSPPAPAAQARPPARRRWGWLPAAGLALAVLALLVAAGVIVNQNRQIGSLRATIDSLQQSVAGLEADLEGLELINDELSDQLRAREDQLATYLAPGAITLALGDITGQNPDSVGSLTIDPASGAATLLVANLPPLAEDQTYQAWLIVDDTLVSAGTFDVDQNGAASHAIEGARPGDFDGVGVSREPAGGSEQPTSDQIILLADFS
jgi:anti-sigma-K factor RskA